MTKKIWCSYLLRDLTVSTPMVETKPDVDMYGLPGHFL